MLGVHRAVAVFWPPRPRAPSRSAPACEEDGSHEDLLGANGHYARLWNMQAGGFLPDADEPTAV